MIVVCRRMLITYSQGHQTILGCSQGRQAWDEALGSIGERTFGTRSALWKGLGGETGRYTNPFLAIALTLSYTE